VTRIGFQNNAVAWMRSDSTLADARAAGGSPADRETRVRDALQVGRDCTAVLQEAGAADREEPLIAGASNGTRYVYAFDATNANAYAAFVCLAGRVTSVERFTPEKIDRGSAPPGARPQ
jgi:poly(3-hydroxybutyrate) depolymerase